MLKGAGVPREAAGEPGTGTSTGWSCLCAPRNGMPCCLSISSPASSKSCFLKQVTVSLAGGAAAPRSSPSLPPPPGLRFPSADIAAEQPKGREEHREDRITPGCPKDGYFGRADVPASRAAPRRRGTLGTLAQPGGRTQQAAEPCCSLYWMQLHKASSSIAALKFWQGFGLRTQAEGSCPGHPQHSPDFISPHDACCRGEAPVSRSRLFWAEFPHFLPRVMKENIFSC